MTVLLVIPISLVGCATLFLGLNWFVSLWILIYFPDSFTTNL